eukprot:365696-Chlamydomonas_euryale.AAC.13
MNGITAHQRPASSPAWPHLSFWPQPPVAETPPLILSRRARHAPALTARIPSRLSCPMLCSRRTRPGVRACGRLSASGEVARRVVLPPPPPPPPRSFATFACTARGSSRAGGRAGGRRLRRHAACGGLAMHPWPAFPPVNNLQLLLLCEV